MKPTCILVSCVVCTFFMIGSCRKGTLEEGSSKLDLLTGRNWLLENLYQQDSGDNQILDVMNLHYAACERDDSYHFTKDGTFFRRDSTSKCANDPHFGLFGGSTWTSDSAFTRITFSSLLYKYDMEIRNLSASSLELRHRAIDYFSSTIFYTYRFKSTK